MINAIRVLHTLIQSLGRHCIKGELCLKRRCAPLLLCCRALNINTQHFIICHLSIAMYIGKRARERERAVCYQAPLLSLNDSMNKGLMSKQIWHVANKLKPACLLPACLRASERAPTLQIKFYAARANKECANASWNAK
jgi:hypothetical protein